MKPVTVCEKDFLRLAVWFVVILSFIWLCYSIVFNVVTSTVEPKQMRVGGVIRIGDSTWEEIWEYEQKKDKTWWP